MTLTTTQYIALSQLAYEDFSQSDIDSESNITDLLQTYEIEEEGEPVLEGLDGIGAWKLVNFQPNSSTTGFAGAAFQSPLGELVFAFRGTESILR